MSDLSTIIGEQFEHPAGPGCNICADVERAADAILAAGYRKPRTITTAEELDALPDGSAVLDSSGDISTKHAHWWHGYETAPLMPSKIAKYGPLTVLHEGKP